ncbi:hypothetical protein PCANC_05462 [Puccinia coronata f. sp. avenae]|uniref:Uncharacterized protein n=1 Tax=Puccinia coronata f. sp. avenae TaxID=200324 RepID=A0A2N5T6I2_9BASI|nr:hypothetical protein PCANC_05462 [Puccinia coronata f. sp. avenae]
MNMEDDSFDGNESTLILCANPAAAGPSSSGNSTRSHYKHFQFYPEGKLSAAANANEPHPSSSKTRHQF